MTIWVDRIIILFKNVILIKLKRWVMKTIRIDVDVYEHLGRLAVNFETPNQVIRRISGLEPKKPGKKGPQKQRIRRTPQEAFRIEILRILDQSGGTLKSKKVLNSIGQKMKPLLTKIDYERLNTGQVRWQNTARWARQQLVDEGFLSAESSRGVWEITDEGREFLKTKRG